MGLWSPFPGTFWWPVTPSCDGLEPALSELSPAGAVFPEVYPGVWGHSSYQAFSTYFLVLY